MTIFFSGCLEALLRLLVKNPSLLEDSMENREGNEDQNKAERQNNGENQGSLLVSSIEAIDAYKHHRGLCSLYIQLSSHLIRRATSSDTQKQVRIFGLDSNLKIIQFVKLNVGMLSDRRVVVSSFTGKGQGSSGLNARFRGQSRAVRGCFHEQKRPDVN